MQSVNFKPSRFRQVDVLVGDSNPTSASLVEALRKELPEVEFRVLDDHSKCSGGELLLALSYGKPVPERFFSLYGLATLIHASSLPKGKGWSPANWMLEKLDTHFSISLLEMVKEIDGGPIIAQADFELGVESLWVDFKRESERVQLDLLIDLLRGGVDAVKRKPQEGAATFFPKRTPDDSQIDPFLSIADQWGKIRAADPSRYPNFFRLHGQEFVLEIKRREKKQ